MTTPSQAIFRQEALEYRLRHRAARPTEIAFPKLMASPVRIALWVALAILAIGSVAACLPTVAVNATGLAIVTTETRHDSDSPLVVVLLQDGYRDQLESGKGAEVDLGDQGRNLRGTIVEVEPHPIAPDEVSDRLGLPHAALSMLNDNVALVWVALDGPGHGDLRAATSGRADLEVGTTRAGSFLPLVGRFFED